MLNGLTRMESRKGKEALLGDFLRSEKKARGPCAGRGCRVKSNASRRVGGAAIPPRITIIAVIIIIVGSNVLWTMRCSSLGEPGASV